VAAFFGGLAGGALLLGRRIERSRRPARWYAACELAIALWAAALAWLMAPAADALLALTGAQPAPVWQWAVAFLGTFGLLLPATAAMGATLPAMARVLAGMNQQGAPIGALYAANTLGAVVGVLATAFWLVPAWGLARTAALCAVLNLLCAAAAMTRWIDALSAPDAPAPAQAMPPWADRLLLTLAATGLLGIGYEVLVVRVLSQVAENTVYTFAMLLAVYLVGSAAGAAAYQRWHSRQPGSAPGPARDRLLGALAATCLLGTLSLWGAEGLKAAVQQALGAGLSAALAAEAALAVVAFGPPTLVMGALFSHLGTEARGAGLGLGRALGANTLGAACAPLLFGVLGVPLLGPKFALLAVAGGYLALLSRQAWRAPAGWAVAGALGTLALLAPPLQFVDVPEGGHIVSYQAGAMAAVSVVEDADGVSRLRIDNRQQEGSSSSLQADARQALLPLLLHPAPRRALFLGLGTGLTAWSAAQDPALQVDAVELLPEVISASAHFTSALGDGTPNPRLHLIAADARRFVRAAGPRYDLIVSDNFHPARSGSGALYTVQHFRAVQGRLTEGGLFCQWLPLHQLDTTTLRSIVQAFRTVYPGGAALLASNSLDTPVLGLVAHRDGRRFAWPALRARLASVALPRPAAAFGLPDELAVLGSLVAGPQALARFAGDAPVNTDDHPVVAYLAPRITYAPDALPRDRLLTLLRGWSLAPDEVVAPAAGAGAVASQRLAAYWAARQRFLEAGRSVQPLADVRQMLAQVREPLLDVLRLSPDFRPAYDPLLRMAGALSRSDRPAAQALLAELARLQPARAEAALALRQLDGSPP